MRGWGCSLQWVEDRLEVRAFGVLSKELKARVVEYTPGSSGIVARELARELGLSLDKIECVMVDGKAQDLDFVITHEKRVAFIPYGTPGPYRLVMGLKRDL